MTPLSADDLKLAEKHLVRLAALKAEARIARTLQATGGTPGRDALAAVKLVLTGYPDVYGNSAFHAEHLYSHPTSAVRTAVQRPAMATALQVFGTMLLKALEDEAAELRGWLRERNVHVSVELTTL